uniref:NAD(+) kinase n=1 Tax=Erpetoichthys calabaricus TaxID=27687 RepID=A0A8C4S1M4_ERPCA
VEISQAKSVMTANKSKDQSPELSCYSCVACNEEELQWHGNLLRGRTKARSLSSSPAPGNSLDFRRTRSLHGPSPVTKFGPKACMLQNPKTIMHIQDPANQRLLWSKPPKSVLIIKKVRDATLLQPFKELCIFLTEVKRLIIYVERKVLEDPEIEEDDNFVVVKKKFCTFLEGKKKLYHSIVDLLVCLGSLPCCMTQFQPSFSCHTNGLTFDSRILCSFLYNGIVLQHSYNEIFISSNSCQFLKMFSLTVVSLFTTHLSQVLNEVVVDRGPSSYLSNVDLFLDGHLITTVQGDGVIVSTPTGSTAYAVAAGASMIHPNVPAIMITPVCPHSLSFRPIVVPAGVELKIMLSPDSRNTAWVSLDGRKRQEICHGDSITITTSCYPVPSICFRDPVNDWFESLAECLHWNVRKKQSYFVSEEEEF